MLKVISYGGEYLTPCVLLLGGFDGLHDGHKTLLKLAKESGYAVGITSLSGGKQGGDVFTFAEREKIYERAGISFAVEILFTEEIKRTPAEQFIATLCKKLQVKGVFCGEDFRFGKNAEGTPELLKKLLDCPVTVLPLLSRDGKKIATSEIKKLLSEGQIDRVNALLGSEYFLQGRVERGRQVGRSYGFPTANLTVSACKFPLKEGVYGGRVRTERGEYPAIINLGNCPTFGVAEKKAEAYLDGFSGDLYGQSVCIYPQTFYRPIAKFESVDALKTQLNADILRLRSER